MLKNKTLRNVLLGIAAIFIMIAAISQKTEAAVNYVSLGTNNAWISGEISQKGEIDYYQVNLSSDGWLTVDYQGLSVKDSYIEIWNYDLTKCYREKNVYGSSSISPKNHTERLALERGSYIVKIYGYQYGNYVGDYRVKASFKPANNNESSNNDSFATAQKLNLKQTVKGFISEDNRLDFYKIQLNSTKTVRFIFTSYIYSSNIELWDSDYIQLDEKDVDYASEDAPKTYVYEKKLTPGIYYVKIRPYKYGNYTGRYNLKYEEKIMAKSISVSGNKVVTAGQSFSLKATVSPSNTTDKTIEWSSGDSNVANVDSKTGRVTTYRPGKVNITASAKDGSNATKVITVIVKPKKMRTPYGYKTSKTKAYVSWGSDYGVSGYQLQYSTNKKFTNAVTKKYSSNTTYKTLKKLGRHKYYIRVRGYVKKGKKYYYGKWSGKLVINMKK